MSRAQNIFNLVRGDKFDGPQVTLNVTEDDGVTPKDMSGTTVRSQLRDKVDGGDLTYEFTINVDTSTAGVVEFTLTAAGSETASWPLGTLYGDIQIEGPSDFGPYTFVKYIIKVEADVTQ